MESYKIKSFKAAPVNLIDEAATCIGGQTLGSTFIRTVGERRQGDPTAKLFKTLLEKIERMEYREHEKMPCLIDQQYWDRRDRGRHRQRGTQNKTELREDSAFGGRGGRTQPCGLLSLWVGGTLCSWLCSQEIWEISYSPRRGPGV